MTSTTATLYIQFTNGTGLFRYCVSVYEWVFRLDPERLVGTLYGRLCHQCMNTCVWMGECGRAVWRHHLHAILFTIEAHWSYILWGLYRGWLVVVRGNDGGWDMLWIFSWRYEGGMFNLNMAVHRPEVQVLSTDDLGAIYIHIYILLSVI